MGRCLSILLLALCAGLIASASPLVAIENDKAPFDPAKGLKVGQKVRLFDEQFQSRAIYQAVLKALYDTQE